MHKISCANFPDRGALAMIRTGRCSLPRPDPSKSLH